MAPRKQHKKPGLLDGILGLFGGNPKKKKPASKGSRELSDAPKGKKGASLQKRRPPMPKPAEEVVEQAFETPVEFTELTQAVPEITPEFSLDAAAFAPSRPVQPEPEEHPLPPVGGALFPEGVDDSLDAIFDNFEAFGGFDTPAEPKPPAAPPVAAPAPAPATPPPPPPVMQPPTLDPPVQAVPQPPVPPVPPMARPPIPPPPVAPVPPVASVPVPPQPPVPPKPDGLVSIGKLLVDQGTLKRIIDKGEKTGNLGSTRVISQSRGHDIDALLASVDRVGGVTGSLVVGRDGLVIASTLPPQLDRELVGAIASSLFSNSDHQCKKMTMGGLHQAILETEMGVLVMVSIELGVLVVVSQDTSNLDLPQVLMAISSAA